MFSQRQVLGSLAGLGIMLGLASGVRANQISTHPANSTAQFRQIEQPISLKIGITAGGLSLKKEEGRRKKEEGRRKKRYTASFLASRILRFIRWIYLKQSKFGRCGFFHQELGKIKKA
ncbi:MAG: hypothetical protein JGK23_12975 [Microcoleus sp. PH2017_19_SFW_U_A]|nr:hypothetical protein [Microcoleus sp. PH2017_19_SFW_U_A]